MKTFRNPTNVHPPVAGYTHQIELAGAERLLFISGQIGMKEDGSLTEDPIEQIEIAMDNLHRNLSAANMEIADLVKLNIYLVGEIDTERRRAVISSSLKGHKPCMTLVYVAGLASPALRVELDAWASRAE